MSEALKPDDYLPLVQAALAEDIGGGDATTLALVPEDAVATVAMVAREPLVMAGADLALAAFQQVDERVEFGIEIFDGQLAALGQTLLRVQGPTQALLTAERTALNFVQRLAGVATLTARFVEQVAGTGAQIFDTRKTTPGWRALEKYAVACGGGTNHRVGLYDQVMIKDNHLAALDGDIAAAVALAREASPGLKIEVEADTVEQAKAAAESGADIILLDNMSCDELRDTISQIDGRARTEASGGVTLETVREIAGTGVDFISVGALTHSAPSVDIALDFEPIA
ncbi:MAG: carboxylating nicotinate-nucleotide diphosphorylase [Verrucomicrobiota bacterium]|jgi:nicotinate-nucleotide pyrophosphorylase (carboxylating)|nr:carboxylating nicotinate-nucleotide diphosphorylase [Verrucomicrobiota bacterium]MDP7178011.1 carboxylating nicotinate-nucleotide diphosphorylase [Verrucomicrobiota bacterium]MDP7292611.1 carboxylating nicotinate-nucleotide diphosphorylase [Verrucomicrobiota bacterium]|tara:strand:- start:878 stop:1729 length:852 start_codon:yes stop_codon:yes gene_type:complete